MIEVALKTKSAIALGNLEEIRTKMKHSKELNGSIMYVVCT